MKGNAGVSHQRWCPRTEVLDLSFGFFLPPGASGRHVFAYCRRKLYCFLAGRGLLIWLFRLYVSRGEPYDPANPADRSRCGYPSGTPDTERQVRPPVSGSGRPNVRRRLRATGAVGNVRVTFACRKRMAAKATIQNRRGRAERDRIRRGGRFAESEGSI